MVKGATVSVVRGSILRYTLDASLESAVWFNGRHPASSSAVVESNSQGEDEVVLAQKLRQFMTEAVVELHELEGLARAEATDEPPSLVSCFLVLCF